MIAIVVWAAMPCTGAHGLLKEACRAIICHGPSATTCHENLAISVMNHLPPSAVQGLNHVTLFCGDGINDLAALSAADVGMVVGTTDAVVAASLYTRQGSVAGMGSGGDPSCWSGGNPSGWSGGGSSCWSGGDPSSWSGVCSSCWSRGDPSCFHD